MLDPKLKEKLAKAYVRIGDIGYQIALGLKKGKDFTKKQTDLYEKGIKLLQLFKIMSRHVDATTTPPTLYRITEAQVNEILICMEKIGELDRVPVFPSVFPNVKPIVISEGSGAPGADGEDGTDANIVVEAAPGEAGITFTEVEIGGVKHYRADLVDYIEPVISAGVVGQSIFETGQVVASIPIAATTTKGSLNITALTVDDVTLDLALQAIVNLPTLNGGVQPAITTPNALNISTDKNYVFTVTDGNTPKSASAVIKFLFPFLYGASTSTGTNIYTLTKKLVEKGVVEFLFNDTLKYFWIGFPSSYGTVRIYDNNDLDVTDEFTVVTANVTSTGLTNNWTEEYRIYRTTDITEIINKVFRIEFEA